MSGKSLPPSQRKHQKADGRVLDLSCHDARISRENGRRQVSRWNHTAGKHTTSQGPAMSSPDPKNLRTGGGTRQLVSRCPEGTHPRGQWWGIYRGLFWVVGHSPTYDNLPFCLFSSRQSSVGMTEIAVDVKQGIANAIQIIQATSSVQWIQVNDACEGVAPRPFHVCMSGGKRKHRSDTAFAKKFGEGEWKKWRKEVGKLPCVFFRCGIPHPAAPGDW